MRKSAVYSILLLACWLVCFAVAGATQRKKRVAIKPDTLSMAARMSDLGTSRRMMTSAQPVRIHVVGRAVQIQSDNSQILPIYTRNGTFYMAARLNKGVNWISGLPRGHYFINNRPVTID